MLCTPLLSPKSSSSSPSPFPPLIVWPIFHHVSDYSTENYTVLWFCSLGVWRSLSKGSGRYSKPLRRHQARMKQDEESSLVPVEASSPEHLYHTACIQLACLLY